MMPIREAIFFNIYNIALHLKLISKKEVLRILKKLPKNLDLILTGRNSPEELIKIADLVTEFKEIKHPFQRGILAKRGIEF